MLKDLNSTWILLLLTIARKDDFVSCKKKSHLFFIIILSVAAILVNGCTRLPVLTDVGKKQETFLNQDSLKVVFPSDYRGKIVVMSFIYTHCPDVCPLTTNNMQHLQDSLRVEKIGNVQLLSLTFDPNRDTPNILKEYADIRGIDLSNWDFLTGTRASVDTVLNEMDIRYFPGDSSYLSNGKLIYYITHTDKVVLIDKNGKVRKSYRGSTLVAKEVIKDIKQLE
ncbi:MAG: SCO family protein [Candidatus Kryptoniota bacterium]